MHVHKGGQVIASHPVAVGSAEWPTPTGEWTIGQVIFNRGSDVIAALEKQPELEQPKTPPAATAPVEEDTVDPPLARLEGFQQGRCKVAVGRIIAGRCRVTYTVGIIGIDERAGYRPFPAESRSRSSSIAWLVIVAVEMLIGKPGIGGFLWQQYNANSFAHIILSILTIGVIGYVLDRRS